MFIKPFSKISKKDTKIAGGKGSSLGELTNAGIVVPGGFVILAVGFEAFLKENNLTEKIKLELKKVKLDKSQTIEIASTTIQILILKANTPKKIENEIKKYFKKLDAEFVAVRSSATAEDSFADTWAGQLDTFLNITEETLLENVKKCWASLFTPRAIFYRFEKNLDKEDVLVAVVIQKMIVSEKSGIAFSVHPVTEDKNQILIEAGFGLGEAIVSGSITPDSYVVEKELMIIIDKNISIQNKKFVHSGKGKNKWVDLSEAVGGKQVITDEQILKLSELILKIENHYNSPQDIEWAQDKTGRFHITQSRPITTLNKIENKSKK